MSASTYTSNVIFMIVILIKVLAKFYLDDFDIFYYDFVWFELLDGKKILW